MPTQALLIAGPCHLDDFPNDDGLIGGAGAYAAIAAAAIVPCQLWARVSDDYPQQCLQILERRRIDIAGVIAEGPNNGYDGEKMIFNGPVLPEASPHDAEQLAATLCIDLPRDEAIRAWKDLAQLKKSESRLSISAPGRSCTDEDSLALWAKNGDMLIIDYERAAALCQIREPVKLAINIQAMGCTTVILCNGQFGGLIQYKNKNAGYLSIPNLEKEPTGRYASFVGVVAASICSHGKLDFRGLKRACANGGAVSSMCTQGNGPRKLLDLKRDDYQQLYNKLRRNSKF